MPIATPTSLSPTSPLNASEPTFYQSYSCDDLYLASDLTPGRSFSNSTEPINEQECETPTTEDGQQQSSDQEADDELVFDEINLGDPAAVTEVCKIVSVDDSQC
jgi:hypothetical protein